MRQGGKLRPPGKPNAFGMPRGLMGALAGWIMARTNEAHNRWAVAKLDPQPADHVLEIGFGAGTALAMLASRVTEGFIAGVDPSPVMLGVPVATRGERAVTVLLVLLGFVGVLVGFISFIWPTRRLGIRSRRTAAWVFASGILMWIVAGAMVSDDLPTSPTSPPPPIQQAAYQAGSRQDREPGDQASSNPTEQEREVRPGITQARVTKVVDGDTIDVEVLAGAALPASRVRLIGVDTPEVHGRTDPYGAEASAFTREHLTGQTIWLEKDVSDTDQYGRALRYVWLAEPPREPTEDDAREHLFNALLVLGGYAQLSTYPPDVKYADLFTKFQREAREAQKGLWGLVASAEEPAAASQPASSSSTGRSGAEAPTPSQNCDPSYPDVCIPPPPPDLDCGDIPYRRFRVLSPDPHRFDGDRDGVGCES